MSFVIEKGVPLPGRSGGITETLRAMVVGDSVLAACDDTRRALVQMKWTSTARRIAIRITTRQVDGGVRVWRVA